MIPPLSAARSNPNVLKLGHGPYATERKCVSPSSLFGRQILLISLLKMAKWFLVCSIVQSVLKILFPFFLSLYMIVTDKISAPKIPLNSHLICSIFFLSFFYFFKVRQGYEESQGVIFDRHVITEKLGSLHMGIAQNWPTRHEQSEIFTHKCPFLIGWRSLVEH